MLLFLPTDSVGEPRLRSPAVRTKSPVRRALVCLRERLRQESQVLSRIVTQTKDQLREISTPGRVYSAHEPEVTCITKNKAGKPHEYGVKVFLAVDERGMVVTHAEYADNRHDSTTLEDTIAGWEEATGALPKKLSADRGYGARSGTAPPTLSRIPKVAIPQKGKIRGPLEHTRWFKRLVASLAGIEAVIAHLKTHHGMGRCRYKGFSGDRMNVSWAVLAWNTKKWVLRRADKGEGCPDQDKFGRLGKELMIFPVSPESGFMIDRPHSQKPSFSASTK